MGNKMFFMKAIQNMFPYFSLKCQNPELTILYKRSKSPDSQLRKLISYFIGVTEHNLVLIQFWYPCLKKVFFIV